MNKHQYNESDVEMFLELLDEGKWTFAADLLKMPRRTSTKKWTVRYLSLLAANSKGRIISGDKGYRLTIAADADECTHAENLLLTWSAALQLRAEEVRRCVTSHS